MAPSGSWYFHSVDGTGANDVGYAVTDDMYPPLDSSDPRDADWHFKEILFAIDIPGYIRRVPNEEMMHPFLEAFAKAAGNMPVLRAFALWSPLASGAAWGIVYARPGEFATLYSPKDNFSAPRQLWWKVRRWRPSPSVHELFQDIGRAEHGGEMLEHWNDEADDEAWTDPETFTEYSTAFPNSGGDYPAWTQVYDGCGSRY